MTDIATLGIKIEAKDIRNAVRELNRLEKQSDKVESKTNKVRQSFNGLGAAISALGIGLLTRQVIGQINVYTSLNNKLKLVTDGTEGLAKAHDDLFEIAQDTRGSLEGTIDLYSRLARSTEELGISGDRLAAVTKTVNQTIALSGAEAATAQASLFQLGQGLGAGALRGEELNSVLEGTPELARAIANGLGVTIGQLREMGAAGELTAERVIGALEDQSDSVDKEFGQTAKTVQQALQQIENVALKTFGSLDSSDLIEGMDELRAIISDPAIVSGLQSIGGAMLELVNLGVKAAAGWGMIFQLIKDIPDTPLERLADMSEEIGNINDKIKAAAAAGRPYQSLIEDLKEATSEYNELKASIDASNAAMTGGEDGDLIEMSSARADKLLEIEKTRLEEEAHLNRWAHAMKLLHIDEVTEATRQAAEQQKQIEFAKSQQIVTMGANLFNSLSGFINALPGENEKAAKIIFKVQKLASAAQAYINTELAATKALTIDPTGSLSAWVRGLGMASVGLIGATAFMGGGGSGGGGGGTAPSTQPDIGAAPETAGFEPAPTVQELRVVIEGDAVGSTAMREFALSLEETINDMGGVSKIVVSS